MNPIHALEIYSSGIFVPIIIDMTFLNPRMLTKVLTTLRCTQSSIAFILGSTISANSSIFRVVIAFSTTGIHSGMPCEAGGRSRSAFDMFSLQSVAQIDDISISHIILHQ